MKFEYHIKCYVEIRAESREAADAIFWEKSDNLNLYIVDETVVVQGPDCVSLDEGFKENPDWK